MTLLRRISRICGNFGISFFTPLAAINIGTIMFETHGGLSFNEIIIISLIASVFATGLSVSREAVDWGSENVKRRT